ncbi:MAG: hypothetical protein IJH67_06095 [Thermoguttaceae bacterium]|nr:hypothetical protein [Thermoguttaceae bacterium]
MYILRKNAGTGTARRVNMMNDARAAGGRSFIGTGAQRIDKRDRTGARRLAPGLFQRIAPPVLMNRRRVCSCSPSCFISAGFVPPAALNRWRGENRRPPAAPSVFSGTRRRRSLSLRIEQKKSPQRFNVGAV